MDRIGNKVVRRRAGIERESASTADQRVLRCFGHVVRLAEYRMARSVFMAVVSGGRVRGRLDRWCEGGMGQQKNDEGGATIRDKSERVESSGAYVTECP